MSRSLRGRLGLLVLLCGAFAVRVYQLDAHGLWYDEAFSYWIAAKDWSGILEFARAPKLEHPPVYYFLLHAWLLAAGSSEFSLRFFSLWWSVLAVAVLYRFTRRWFSPALARWSVVLAALSPFANVYAQEARMYTLVLCISLLALDYFLRWFHHERGERYAWAAYVLFTTLSISIHYYAALLLLVENLYVLLHWLSPFRNPFSERPSENSVGGDSSRRPFDWAQGRFSARRRNVGDASDKHLTHFRTASERKRVSEISGPFLKLWLAWNALLVLLALIGILVSPGPRETLRLVFNHPLFAGRDWNELQRVLVDLFLGGVVIRPLTSADVWLSAVMLLLVVSGAIRLWQPAPDKNPRADLLLLLLSVPPLVAAAVPLIYAARYLFMVVPGIILLSAAALIHLRSKNVFIFGTTLLGLLVSITYGLWFNYSFVKSPYREMAAVIAREARADDGVILNGTSQWPLAFYYLHGRWIQRYIPETVEAAELSDIDPAMRAMQVAHARLWVIAEQSTVVDPANNTSRWLSLNAYPVSRRWAKSGDAVALFLSGNALAKSARWDAEFGEWFALEQSAISESSVFAGGGLAVQLVWHALKAIPQSQRLLVTLRLFNSEARVVQERVTPPCDGFCPIDDWIAGEAVVDRHGLLVPADASPGEYSLRLEVFASRQKQSLPIKMAQGDVGTSLELARITVRGAATSAQR